MDSPKQGRCDLYESHRPLKLFARRIDENSLTEILNKGEYELAGNLGGLMTTV